MAIGTPVAGTLAENATAATSLAVPYPATIAAGDLLLMWVAVSVASVPNLPAGWTSIVSGSSGTGSQSPSNRWYYKVATGSETGTQAVTHSNATSRGLMWAISGVDTTTPIDVVGTHTAAAIGGSTTHPGVTTTTTGCQVWASAMKNLSAGSYPTVTSPFTMTEAIDDGTPYPTTQVSYLTWAGSGATGTFTFGSDTSVRAGYDVFALRPAATSVSGSAAVAAPAATAAGSGDLSLTGAGAVTSPSGQASGSATLIVTGTGAVTSPAASGTGAGTLTVTGTGAAVAPAATAAGTGDTAGTVSGAGAVASPAATATGAGTLTTTATGTATAPPAAASGAGTLIVVGAGDATAPTATAAGTAEVVVAGLGVIEAPAAVAAGSGTVTAPTWTSDITVTATLGPRRYRAGTEPGRRAATLTTTRRRGATLAGHRRDATLAPRRWDGDLT